MKKLVIIASIFLLLYSISFAEEIEQNRTQQISNAIVYKEKNNFGLKDPNNNILVVAQYKKLIRVGKTSWIIQKKNRFGVIDSNGNYLVEPKYRHVERIFGKYIKLGNESDYGLHDEYGNTIISHEYTQIEPLYENKFLTCKNFKYGLSDEKGKVLIENSLDDIYMPTPQTLRVKYEGEWYELAKWKDGDIELPDEVQKVNVNNTDLKVTRLAINTGLLSGYSALTATDYTLKLLSSLSPAYAETIDELMLSQGAETVSIFVKLGWLPKFPVTYAKKYYSNLRNPHNGPLSDIRKDIKRQIQ